MSTTIFYPPSTTEKPVEVTRAAPLPMASFQDAPMAHAINEIFGTYGHTVSVYEKAKSLNKFGRSTNADDGVRTTVAEFGSVATVNVNETYVTTNAIDEIASSSGSDTGDVTLEGHTIDVSGNLTFSIQTLTLTGQTPVTLATPLARASRCYVTNGTFAVPAVDLIGDVYIYKSGGTVTAGVPQTSADVKLRIVAGKNQTEKCATSVSSVDYWLITELVVSMERTGGGTTSVDFELEMRMLGGVWRPMGPTVDVDKNNPSAHLDFHPYRIVPPNADVRLVATSDTADTVVSGEIEGYLAIIT